MAVAGRAGRHQVAVAEGLGHRQRDVGLSQYDRRPVGLDLGLHFLFGGDGVGAALLREGLSFAGVRLGLVGLEAGADVLADVDVGENIGAKLQIDQANADKQIAQAKAEERRAMAVALEQEMQARVVEAEAEVPRAMAEAFRQGNLGLMDYYRMKNVQADTTMREAIADTREEPATGSKT